jgi:hypothetical protein
MRVPYEVRKDTNRCPVSKPWAVISKGSGETKGCHATKEKAGRQRAAIEANTDEKYDRPVEETRRALFEQE